MSARAFGGYSDTSIGATFLNTISAELNGLGIKAETINYKIMTNYTKLQDYTTEELRAELKRRSDLAKAEKAKVKRCRMCKYWGIVDFTGKPLVGQQLEMMKQLYCSKPCEFFRNKSGKRVRCHAPSQLACEHFEEL